MSLYRYEQDPQPRLEAPVLITALEGWVDAGGAASGTGEHIARLGTRYASFDTDEVLDYRARRPILDVVDGIPKQLQWPELVVTHVRAGIRDLLVLTGPEPDQRWRAFATAVLELALRAGVIESITVGSIPATVPHTRETPVMATASRAEDLPAGDPVPEGFLRVPAAAVSVLSMTLADAGIPARGFFAQTPHYVAQTYAPGVLALVERIERHLGVSLSSASLVDEAARSRSQLDAIVESRPEVAEYVERLEELAPGERVPSGDEIAAEIEKYLRGPGSSER